MFLFLFDRGAVELDSQAFSFHVGPSEVAVNQVGQAAGARDRGPLDPVRRLRVVLVRNRRHLVKDVGDSGHGVAVNDHPVVLGRVPGRWLRLRILVLALMAEVGRDA